MARIVSVWLERWPVRRLLRDQQARGSSAPVDDATPLVLAVDAAGGPCIAALNEAAERAGLSSRGRIADARALVSGLQIRPADPAADDAALRRLALWAMRYTPTVALWSEPEGADGLFLDVTGGTHLFGGERALLGDLGARLQRFGLSARLALAGTPGAAWALARFGARRATLVPAGGEGEAVSPLPVEALRLPEDVAIRLRRLGFKRVADLMHEPRAPLTTRFGRILVRRLDEAFGRVPEAIVPLSPPPAYSAARPLLEPIGTQAAIVAVTMDLMADLLPALERDGVGARDLRLTLHRVDGETATVDLGLAVPTRSPAHVGRLMQLKLESPDGAPDAGHGFELLRLDVTAAEPVATRQLVLAPSPESGAAARFAGLIDALRQRFGEASVRHLRPRESHIPERAVRSLAYEAGWPAWPEEGPALRPLLILSPPEPADTLLPDRDEPPQRFRWRGILHHVAHAEGPERIAPEWWRGRIGEVTRDYYLVEDRAGLRLWMFRAGRPALPAPPRWFVHGLFA
ncbi:MAG TPA: DNA polymerase Y family protein [Microvirga sp.]|jgi:protein ImuB|nr:DNA polymerase Y family protein [Microvirga sp.]